MTRVRRGRPPRRAHRAPASPRTRPDAVRLVCGALLTTTLLALVARDFPLAGHDLRYYIPRLLDTLVHQQINGVLATQWYTPAFGGGLPAYPNPQHLQYSLLQALTLVMNPWWAWLATIAAASAAGFYAFAAFLERRVGLGGRPATLGAIFFIGNGFYVEHLIVGHVGFVVFPLSAVILWTLTDDGAHAVKSGSVIALVVAAMLYQAGVHVILLSAFSLLLALPVAALVNPRAVPARRALATAAVALPVVGLLAASKVYAVMAFMRQFPRVAEDVYSAGLLQALAGLAMQLSSVMTLAPVLALLGLDPALVGSGLSRLVGASDRFGLWELDVSLSPVLWGLLVIGVLDAIRRVRATGARMPDPWTLALGVAAATMTWLLVEATLARGLVYPWLKPLPVLRSLHVNPRIAAAFIMPLAIVAAAIAHRRFGERAGAAGMTALIVLSLASPLVYALFPAAVHARTFDLRTSLETYARIRAGESLAVTRMVAADDPEALAIGGSSLLPYEPLFGYDLAQFKAEVVPGGIRQVSGSAFNMTNPASLVYPEVNGLRPFQRIAVEDEANLDALASRGVPQWRVPDAQRWCHWASLSGLALSVAALALPRRARER